MFNLLLDLFNLSLLGRLVRSFDFDCPLKDDCPAEQICSQRDEQHKCKVLRLDQNEAKYPEVRVSGLPDESKECF